MPRPRTFDETEVVAAARDEFWSRGYAATSVDDLTAVTGLGKGSLYGAFGDKHGLFLRALDDYIGTALESVRAQLRDPQRDAYDRLTRHIRAQAKAVAGDRKLRGCMMAKSAAELAATDDDVERAVTRAYSEWHADLVACIEEAQRDGTIDAEQNAQPLATTLLTFMRGLEALHKGGVKPAQIRAAAEEMIALIPRGLE
ncbi:TetR/AcrR family transcriptional regulator [Mycobacterium sp.]|uniref:TetR/AcrR family transcriptional regulator n=1 Tax=Mycobacterium sp. TaxID=1785 RepID=UPI002CD0A0BE|nr:TetR/AcrR family transcriptional regulator [Mycobacterium sp.]HKP42773.1 TetR/AcrR family transcriptional regulator [Mycobacterium sp.]